MCGGFEFLCNSSNFLCVLFNFPLVLILVLCTLQELPVPLSTAIGQIWRLEVTSVSAMKDGGELDATIQDIVIVSLKIVAEIPTCVTITGDPFGMNEYQHTIRAVTVILVANNCKHPKGKSIVSSMRAPGFHSVRSIVFVTMYLEIIQRLESMRVLPITADVMEVSYDLFSVMLIMFSLLPLPSLSLSLFHSVVECSGLV